MNRVKESGKKFLFLGVSLAALCGLFLPFEAASLWWREALNSAHVILFFFVSIALYFFFSARSFFSNSVTVYLAVLVAGMAIGVAIELLQGLLQRETSADDLYRNFFGMASGISFVAFLRQKKSPKSPNRIFAAALSFGFLLGGVAPLFQISSDYLQRDKALPFITGFEEKWFSRFLHFDRAAFSAGRDITRDGEKLHRIKFDPGQYPGLEIIEPEKNWSTYHKLHFHVFSDNPANVSLVLKVYDEEHNQNYNDRFNRSFVLQPGLNEIIVNLSRIREAPIGRKLDLANISAVQLFLINTESPVFLELSNLLLEK